MHDHLLGDYLSSWGSNHIEGVYVLNGQLTSLGACLADKISSRRHFTQVLLRLICQEQFYRHSVCKTPTFVS
jgi:hypothetical protein